jgi:hypothetical protein
VLRPNQPPIIADAIDILAQISAIIDGRGDTESKIERIRELVE